MSFDDLDATVNKSESIYSEFSMLTPSARRPSNIVSRILTKTVNASANEVLAASDVTIESKKANRIYAFANLLALMLEFLMILALQLEWIGNFKIFTINST
jgi:hypothetical protein